MKTKSLRMVLMMSLILSSASFVKAQVFSGGTGTETDPYRISTVVDLQQLSFEVNSGVQFDSKYFILTNDLDMCTVCGPDVNGDELNWTPIGFFNNGAPCPFKGFFDGQGHAISNLYCNSLSGDYIGLFGYVEHAKIQRLNMKNVDLTGKGCLGGVCAYMASSTISQCTVDGKIRTKLSGPIGGVSGLVSNSSTITECLNMSEVSADSLATAAHVGGICGYCDNSKLFYAFNGGFVEGGLWVAGICGKAYRANLYYCVNTAGVTTTVPKSKQSSVFNDQAFSKYSNCYYDKQMSPLGGKNGSDVSGKVEGRLTLQMTGEITQMVLDSTNAVVKKWVYAGGMYPHLKVIDSLDVTAVSAAPVFLVENNTSFETARAVRSDFSVNIAEGLRYGCTGDSAVVAVNSRTGEAMIINNGTGILTISKNTVSKNVRLTTLGVKVCTFNNNNGNGDGMWSTPSNWDFQPVGNDERIVVSADVIVDAGSTVKTLLINKDKILTINPDVLLSITGAVWNNGGQGIIQDGGQLMHSTEGMYVTMQKEIMAWTDVNEKSGWYLISSPIGTVPFSSVENLEYDNYDLYRLDETNSLWENAKSSHNDFTTLETGKGYLYGNGNDVTLEFNGVLPVDDKNLHLSYYPSGAALSGFYLLGNPYSHEIYKGYGGAIDIENLADGYYRLNNMGSWEPCTYKEAIDPCESVLVKAVAQVESVNIVKTSSPAIAERAGMMRSTDGFIEVDVSNGLFGDRTFVHFGHGTGLDKISHLNEAAPMLFIPQEDMNYAIATLPEAKDDVNPIPICFRARTMGDYTITFKFHNVDFDYIHLVDHMTGADIDLKMQNSYNFYAQISDYASRFKLVFSPSENDETTQQNFAYCNNNNLIINNIENIGVLQLIDIQGRILFNQEVYGSFNQTINLPGGVYIIRLIEGEKVRIQKIVIK